MKILIIEDDKFLRKVIKKKFSKEGYEIIEAIDGEIGLNIAKEEKVDLILLDLVLPELDGFEVLDKLKSDPKSSRIPVIILSNLGDKDDVKKGLEKGAVDYLIKSNFDPSEIFKRVEAILKSK